MNETHTSWGIDLLPEQFDERVERVVLDIAMGSPHAFDQSLTRDHAAAAADQIFQQTELGPSQGKSNARASDAMGCGIDREIRHLQRYRLHRWATPGERVDACQQHLEGKRLGEIVVGSGIQPEDDVGISIARRQHQHRRPASLGAYPPQHAKTVEIGKHHVEHDDIELRRERGTDSSGATLRPIDDVAFFGEPALQKRGHPRVVLSKQNPHVRGIVAQIVRDCLSDHFQVSGDSIEPMVLSYRLFGASLICLALAAPAAAQVTPAGALTLQAAMDRALAANPTIAAAQLRGAIGAAGLALARERPNPEAAFEIEKEAPKQSYALAVPLELGGKRGKRIAVSEATIRAGRAELAATIAQVRNDVRRAYYDALVADARRIVLRELRDVSQRTRDTAQVRFDAGDAPRLEVLQAGLALAAAENEAVATQGASIAAGARLNALLGQPLDAAQPLPTAIDNGSPVVMSAALDLARSGNTELAVLDRQIDEQRAKLVLARALRVPDVIPTATLTHDAQPEFTYGWRVGVSITLPIFTSHRAGVTVEQATLDQLMAQRTATELRITGDVAAAAAIAESQRLAYERYRTLILPQAQQVEQLAQDSYQLGQTGIATLLQALQASRDIRLRSLDTVSQWQTALADLERAIGAPIP